MSQSTNKSKLRNKYPYSLLQKGLGVFSKRLRNLETLAKSPILGSYLRNEESLFTSYWQIQGFPLAGLWNKAEVRFGGKQLLWFIKQYLILKQNMKLRVFVELSDGNTLTELYWNRRFWPFCNTFDAYKGEQILKLQLRCSKSNIQKYFYIKICKNQRFLSNHWKHLPFFINFPI